MRIVATEAGDAARIHQAVRKIVALHAVLVTGSVRVVHEVRLAELMLFKLPVVREAFADIEADGPVIVLPLNRVLQRLALGVTLDAGVVGVDIAEARRVEDVVAHRLLDMRLAGAMTFFAADIPFRDRPGRDIEIDGVAAVAERSGRALEIVGWVEHDRTALR